MENVFSTTANALREVLQWVDTTHLSPEGNEALENLFEMVSKVDPELEQGEKSIKLCDLNSYKNYTLWAGREDVEYLIKEGEAADDFLPFVDEKDLPALIDSVSETISWGSDSFADCSAGNMLIQDAIDEVFQKYIEQKSFLFAYEIYSDDPNDPCFYGDLRSNEFLVEKLEKEALTSVAASMLRKDASLFFSASYDVRNQEPSVWARYYLGTNPLANSVILPLSKEQKELLSVYFESSCQQSYSSKDCLTVLNENRIAAGLEPWERPSPSQANSNSFLLSNNEVDCNDWRIPCFYGEFTVTDYLMDKLKDAVGEDFALLCKSPEPIFTAEYNVQNGTVSLFANCYFENALELPEDISIYLSAAEQQKIAEIFEQANRADNDGKDCLTVLNDSRMKYGLKPIKPSLFSQIENAQRTVPDFSQKVHETVFER